jgi:hypothetical protein
MSIAKTSGSSPLRSKLAIAISLVLAVVATQVLVAAPVAADQWSSGLSGPNEIGAVIIESRFTGGVSNLQAISNSASGLDAESFQCEIAWQGPCSSRDLTITGTLTLGLCESAASQDCVEGISMRSAELGEVRGEFLGDVSGPTVTASTSFGVPAGATAGKWRVPGFIHAGGTDTYFVSLSYSLFAFERKPASIGKVSINIAPYTEVTGDYSEVSFEDAVDARGKRYAYQVGPAEKCVWQETGLCGVAQDFAPDVSVTLNTRMSNKIGGWFNGRLTRPDIRVTRHSGTSNRISITGEPVRVQRVAASVPRSQASPEFLKQFDGPSETYFALTEATSIYAFSDLRAMKKQLDDTAVGVSTHWTLETSGSFLHPCLGDTSRVNGIVTTNSTVYQGGAPEFSRGFLNYKVGGLHYEADGVTKAQGSYDLVMRSDVARCLYGFSNAPVSATVTITGEGDSNIATTVVSERNGWLKLAAYGFTFSQKTIKVKLTQPLSRTLNKFSGRTTTLSASQRSQIRTLVTNLKSAKTITCTAKFVKAADRATALKRAQNACSHARSVNRNFKFTSVARQVKNTNQDRTVIVRSS